MKKVETNEISIKELVTVNYKKHKKSLFNIKISDIIRAYNYINTLSQFIPEENEVLDDLSDVSELLGAIIDSNITSFNCPECSNSLFLSDIPQYDFVCYNCDENFYEEEIK